MSKLMDALIDAAELLDWSVHIYDDYIEFEKYSPAGEDFIFTITGNDEARVAEQVREYAYDFDPDEHAEMWVESRGKRGGGRMILEAVVCPDCGELTVRNIQIDEFGTPVWACQKCGVVHEDRSWYRCISQKEAEDIINTREPRGLFLLDTGIEVVGIDNETGHAWTEEFPGRMECMEWLIGDREASQ